jgi:signal transduction histidine kinase
MEGSWHLDASSLVVLCHSWVLSVASSLYAEGSSDGPGPVDRYNFRTMRLLGRKVYAELAVHHTRMARTKRTIEDMKRLKSPQRNPASAGNPALKGTLISRGNLRMRRRRPAHSRRLLATEKRTKYVSAMHDSVTQSLFSLSLTLRAARRNMSQLDEESALLLDEAERLAQHAVAQMCALTFEMRPQVLNEAGLASALNTCARAVQTRTKLAVDLKVTGERRLSAQLEEALYQLIREALEDMAEHPHAREARVEVDLGDERVYIAIRSDRQDDDSSDTILSRLRMRTEAIGGAMEVEKLPEGGSEVRVIVPVPRALDFVSRLMQ